LVTVASADAGPRTASGKISPTISQVIGPKLICAPACARGANIDA